MADDDKNKQGNGTVSESDTNDQGGGDAGEPKGDAAKGSQTPPKEPAKSAADLGLDANAVDVDSMDMGGLLKHVGLEGKESEMAETFAKTGKLSDEHYAAMKKAGVPKAVVNRMMALEMQAATASVKTIEAHEAEGVDAVGGREKHDQLRKWARENMPATKLASLSNMVKADPSTYPTMMLEIKRAFDRENGSRSYNSQGQAKPPESGKIESPKDVAPTIRAAVAGDPAAVKKLKNTPLSEITRF